jgi:hypothetical protein
MSHPLANKVQQTPTVQINLNDDRLSRLKSELLAIELWDTDYYRLERPCPSDEEAYQSRQLRRKEILQEILSTASPDPAPSDYDLFSRAIGFLANASNMPT